MNPARKSLCKGFKTDIDDEIRFLCGGSPISMRVHQANQLYNEFHGQSFGVAQRTCCFFKSKYVSGNSCVWTDSMNLMCECPEATKDERLMLELEDI